MNAILLVVTLLYPLALYLGADTVEPRVFALVLLALFGARLLLAGAPQRRFAWPAFVGVGLLAGGAMVTNSSRMLLYYPAMVNALLLALFAASLWFTPTVVERIARLREPELPPSGVAYTRRVTVAWCFFFR